jgi:adenylate cyclase
MRHHFIYTLLIAPVILLAAALALAPIGAVDRLREVVFDTFQRLAPREYDSQLPVRIVAIDDASLAKIGQWPWPRDVLATLTKNLADAGAAVIAFDVVFSEPDQSSPELLVQRLPPGPERSALEAVINKDLKPHDSVFAQALAEAPVVLAFIGSDSGPSVTPKAGFAVAGDDPKPWLPSFAGAVLPIGALLDAAPGLGAVNWIPDGDSVIRRVPTVVVAGQQMAPSLSLEALRLAQGAGTIVVRASNASGETAFGQSSGVNAVKVGDFAIGTDRSGEVRLRARLAEPSAWVSASSVIDGTFSKDEIRGRIVFVGAVAVGLGDRRTTPVQESIPGVEVHAQTIEQVLTGSSLVRPDWMGGLEAALILVGGIALALVLRALRNHPIPAILVSLAFPVILAVASWLLFTRAGLLMDPLVPGVGLLAVTLTATAYHFSEAERRRAQVRGIFGRFVTPAVVEKLTEDPNRIVLGGELRPLTILFSDVRDFTSLSESRTPQEVVSLVRGIHTPATAAVLAHAGTVDKYVGDGMMAFWNAPLADPDHAANACRAALDIIGAMRVFHEPPIRLGIGVHTGEACVGNLGSEQRLEYSALGDPVNVASRVEGLTKLYGVDIVVTDATARAAPDLGFLELDRVRVKGRQGVTTLFALHGVGEDEALLRVQAAHAELLKAYRRGDRKSSLAVLEEEAEAYGSRYSGLHRHYLARIADMPDIAPPGWDGVNTLDHK